MFISFIVLTLFWVISGHYCNSKNKTGEHSEALSQHLFCVRKSKVWLCDQIGMFCINQIWHQERNLFKFNTSVNLYMGLLFIYLFSIALPL